MHCSQVTPVLLDKLTALPGRVPHPGRIADCSVIVRGLPFGNGHHEPLIAGVGLRGGLDEGAWRKFE